MARNKTAIFPSQCLGICQVRSITALGVILNDKLTAAHHLSSILTSCSSSLYALWVLRDHGLQTSSLHDVFRSTILAKVRYCAPAWSGLCSASLNVLLRCSNKYGYCAGDVLMTATKLFATADQSLFKRVLSNEHHMLQPIRQSTVTNYARAITTDN